MLPHFSLAAWFCGVLGLGRTASARPPWKAKSVASSKFLEFGRALAPEYSNAWTFPPKLHSEEPLPGAMTSPFLCRTLALLFKQDLARALKPWVATWRGDRERCFGPSSKTTLKVWDNAKKSFEAGVRNQRRNDLQGFDAHKAAVTGDTVGDPFKDTWSIHNILIKLTCLVGLVIAPLR